MTEKHKPVNRNKPATFNIITSDDAGLASVVMTRRLPSEMEARLCDWQEQFFANGVECNCIGRGPRLTWRRLSSLAEHMLTLTLPWDDGGIVTVETLRDGLKRDAEAAPDEPGVDFANDPVWKRILAVSGGAR